MLETIPTALSKDNAAAGPISSVTARPEGEHNDGEYNSRAESIVSEWKESDLDSVFARLEEQEVAAEEESKRGDPFQSISSLSSPVLVSKEGLRNTTNQGFAGNEKR